MAARLGASLFAGGAAITVAANLLPHPGQADERGYWAMAAVQLLFVALLLTRRRGGEERWLRGFVTFAAIGLVTASVYFNGERLGGPPLLNEFFYVWPALYAGYFFSRRGLVCALLGTAAAYGGVLVAIDAHGPVAITRWVVAVSSVAGLAAAAHALRRQRDLLVRRLRHAVRTDALTGVLNRRGFEEAFARELDRLSRTGEPLSVLVGDLDHFKTINDRFGHAAGDVALAAVAETLREVSRTLDTVARIGGEEFALLLPATDGPGGFQVAERLRSAVGRGTHGDTGPLTMSFGLATCEEPGPTPDALLAAADRALYEAKAQGRNRTIAAPSLPRDRVAAAR